MWQTLVKTARQFLSQMGRSIPRSDPETPRPRVAGPAQLTAYSPLERVVLTDEVGRTLFEEYAQHRSAQGRGNDETGWVLLGLRERSEAVVLATLPAGTEADASVSHVRFNSSAQAVASRIVRQSDRRLTILGVVHTHPGSLRHPSDGDFRGDSQWVRVLRGQEGIFGIGTADANTASEAGVRPSYQPHPNVQCWGELRFSWYTLRQGQRQYRPIPLEVVYGPDLARPLHCFWATLEEQAERLERLVRQQNGVQFQVIHDEWGPGLVVFLPLAEQGDALRVLIRPKEVRYYLLRQGELLEIQHDDSPIDRGVYLLLAELAAQACS
jgi:proteasome lid subunit RPN8/RPN11